jgi:acyl-CoA thioester hydrolase
MLRVPRFPRVQRMMHEKRIEVRWRDCDAYKHVNNAVYATYLEECRDEWLERAVAGIGSTWDYVLARVAIDFRREVVLSDGEVIVRVRLARIGNSSLTLSEEVTKRDGTVAAEAEAVVVARDPETGRSRPLTDGERAAFEATLT